MTPTTVVIQKHEHQGIWIAATLFSFSLLCFSISLQTKNTMKVKVVNWEKLRGHLGRRLAKVTITKIDSQFGSHTLLFRCLFEEVWQSDFSVWPVHVSRIKRKASMVPQSWSCCFLLLQNPQLQLPALHPSPGTGWPTLPETAVSSHTHTHTHTHSQHTCVSLTHPHHRHPTSFYSNKASSDLDSAVELVETCQSHRALRVFQFDRCWPIFDPQLLPSFQLSPWQRHLGAAAGHLQRRGLPVSPVSTQMYMQHTHMYMHDDSSSRVHVTAGSALADRMRSVCVCVCLCVCVCVWFLPSRLHSDRGRFSESEWIQVAAGELN